MTQTPKEWPNGTDPDQKRFREVNQKLAQLREEQARIRDERQALKQERDDLMKRLGKVKKDQRTSQIGARVHGATMPLTLYIYARSGALCSATLWAADAPLLPVQETSNALAGESRVSRCQTFVYTAC